jgi:transposase
MLSYWNDSCCINKYEKLDFSGVFYKHKKKGRDINSLIQALLSYRLTENLSISKASGWINRGEVLETFNMEKFEEWTLFRTLETIGKNREEIISDIKDRLFQTYNFKHTDLNLDWTSLVLYGDKSKYYI